MYLFTYTVVMLSLIINILIIYYSIYYSDDTYSNCAYMVINLFTSITHIDI